MRLVKIGLASVNTTVGAFRSNVEAFLLYAVIYSTLAIDSAVWGLDDVLKALVCFLTAIAAVAGLMIAHRYFRRRAS